MVKPPGATEYHRVCFDCPPHKARSAKPRHEHWPDVLDKATLRDATDDELQAHFTHRDNPRTHKQVLREMQRRDDVASRAKSAKERARSRRFERWENVDREIVAAEAATNGYFLNAKGKASGINDWELFTGDARKADRYASEELLRYWSTHPRPTARNLKSSLTARERDYRATDRFLARAH